MGTTPQFDWWPNDEDDEKKENVRAAPDESAAIADATVSDAVWLRRQLARWSHCSRDAACVITKAEVEEPTSTIPSPLWLLD